MPRQEATGRTTASGRLLVRDMKASLGFNGSSSCVSASSLTNMSLGYSVGVWVKLRTINGGAVFTNATATNDRCGITTSSTGFVRAGYYNGTSYVDPVSSDSPLVPGRWTHIAHVFDGSSSSLYVNGVLQSGTDQPAVSANNVLEIGRKQDSTLYIHADMSEFIVQKGVQWTQSDVINVMNGIFPSGMERIYRLNEGAGTTAYDSSGNGNDGTITNGTYTSDVPLKPRQPVNRNLVYNGDFEYAPPTNVAQTTPSRWIDGTSGGSTTNDLFGWTYYYRQGTSSVQFDDTEQYVGSYSLKLSSSGSSPQVVASNVRTGAEGAIEVLPSTSYVLTFYMKTEYISGDSSDGAHARVKEMDVNGSSRVYTSSVRIKTSSEWTKYIITVTTASTTRRVAIEPIIIGDTGQGDLVMNAWFDDIVLKPTTPVTRQLIQ